MTPALTVPTLRRWWGAFVIRSIDHVEVIEKVRDDSGWNGRYAFMTLMSAGIAILGLLQSSPAVVIGAMLISPLMGPIIGVGFGLATFDWPEIRTAGLALALGIVLAVLFSALVVLLSPLQNVTEEIASRTRPNLFDLMIALFSALAGAYAMIRGRAGTVVGVAIATALMPPLSVMGFGLATTNWTVLAGSSLLFFTNLMTIAIAAAVVARLYGFGAHLSPQHTMLQTILVVGSLIALAVPLGLALHTIAWETASSVRARDALARQFGAEARLSQIEVAYDAEPISVHATVLTANIQRDAEARAGAALTQLLGRPVRVELEQIRVGTGAEAEAAQIASAQAGTRAGAADRQAREIAERLALLAGVTPEAVLIDREHRRAVVSATPLPGATLAAYRLLEGRLAPLAEDWNIALVPPPAEPPAVTFDGDTTDAEGREAIATAAWASRRLNLPLGVAGPDGQVETVVQALAQAGVRAVSIEGAGAPSGGVRLAWQLPAPPEAP